MTKVKSTVRTRWRKQVLPEKPRPGFPLFAHPSGQWAKKIRKRPGYGTPGLMYFGSWRDDRNGRQAEERFVREWPYLMNGQEPPSADKSDGCTLRQLCNDFLTSKEVQVIACELTQRSLRDYHLTCKLLIDQFGKDRRLANLAPADFRVLRAKLAQQLGPVSLRNTINRVCTVFNHAYPNKLTDKPFDGFGVEFYRPKAKAVRKARNESGPKLFTREEVHRLLDAAEPDLKSMILLGLNCGFGNSDVATLTESEVDCATGWVIKPRVKTEVPRHIPLWKETMAALAAALAVRPKPADSVEKGLYFLTRFGRPLVRVQPRKLRPDEPKTDAALPEYVPIDTLAQRFSKLLRKLNINGRRGLGFYTFRHCFETYGGECRDQVGVDAIMGHVDSSMAGNYRHRISDERLKAVVETVRTWLFGTSNAEGGGT
jgi:integrase